MAYSKHLKMEQVNKIWSKEKNDLYGVWIGNDLLISGRHLNSASFYIDSEDIVSEIGDYSEDSYYLIIDFSDRGYSAIHEIMDSEDLAFKYYYND